MAMELYIQGIHEILNKIENEQGENIKKTAKAMAACISRGGVVHFFGSGHSIIPVMDAFPRYGGFLGLNPLMEPRLMWGSATDSASAPGLLVTERKEDYVGNAFLRYQPIAKGDIMVVYSHGGLNAAPVEAAIYGKEIGAEVVAVTSVENQLKATATHSSGKKLSDLADYLIDNCVPPEDAIVPLEGRKEKVGASSSIATITVTMSMLTETAEILNKQGFDLKIFVSPNVEGFGVNYNLGLFDEHNIKMAKHLIDGVENK